MKTQLNPSLLRGALLVLTGAILFSTKAILVKLAYRHPIDSVSLLALRMMFSLPFFFLAAYFSKKQKKYAANKLTAKEHLLIIALGVAGYYLASLFDFLGLQYVTASLERLILFTYPTLVLIIGAIFLKYTIYKIQVLALLFTYAGIGVAFSGGLANAASEHYLLGGALVFGGAFSYAIFLVGSGYLLPKLGTLAFTSRAMAISAIAVLIHHGISHQWALFHFPASVYKLAALMAIIATVIPSFLISEGIRTIGSANASIIGSIGPISTIVLAYIFLGERLNGIQWLGTILVILGVLTIMIQNNR